MRPRPAVVDTNVVVAGLITTDPASPTARILDGMLEGRFPFLLSVELLDEYRRVLLRERIQQLHGLAPAEIDAILVEVTANAIVSEPTAAKSSAQDPEDQHLWDLLASSSGAVLVTGDMELIQKAPLDTSVMLPRAFVEALR